MSLQLIGHSFHRGYLLVGHNEDFAGMLAHFLLTSTCLCPYLSAYKILKLPVLTFLYGVKCRLSIITRCIENLEILAYFVIFDVPLRISLYFLLRCKKYGLVADCARSSRI